MAILISIPILSFLLILQSVIVSRFPLLHGTADLVLLTIIAWSLQKRVQTAWHWGIIGGLLVSIASALPFGVPLITYLIAVGLAILLRRRVWQVPILAMFVTTFFGTLIAHLIALVALRIAGTPLSLFETVNLITLPSLLLNLILAIPIYAIFSDLANSLYPEELEV
jgi:rod shape-determining protein MreD